MKANAETAESGIPKKIYGRNVKKKCGKKKGLLQVSKNCKNSNFNLTENSIGNQRTRVENARHGG